MGDPGFPALHAWPMAPGLEAVHCLNRCNGLDVTGLPTTPAGAPVASQRYSLCHSTVYRENKHAQLMVQPMKPVRDFALCCCTMSCLQLEQGPVQSNLSSALCRLRTLGRAPSSRHADGRRRALVNATSSILCTWPDSDSLFITCLQD